MLVLKTVFRRAVSALMTVVVAGVVVAVPATAAPGDPEYLTVVKTVTNATPDPGEPFTFEVHVNCSEQSCLDATLTDEFPAELEGFEVRSVLFTPSESVIPRSVTWDVDGVTSPTAPAVLTADTSFTVDFTGAVTAPSGTGLQFGRTFTAQIELVAPADLGPGVYSGTNWAYTEATNSSPDEASATVTVEVAQELDIDVSKQWDPAQRVFQAGAQSTISLSATNASNIDVTSLSLQEPANAGDGAGLLDASNPFTIMDLTGLSAVTAPEGATAMQLDTYVFTGGSWNWVSGLVTPVTASPSLPAGVSLSDVAGVRITYTGTEIEHDGELSFDLDLVQRARDRDFEADLSLATHEVDNTAIATVAAPGLAPVSATASATHVITPPAVDVSAVKNFSPDRIAAGDVTTMQLTATNQSDVGVRTLTLSDVGFFTDNVDFDGFGTTFSWPAGATHANITYFMRTAGPPQTETVMAPNVPVGPPGAITGLEIEFVAATGAIESGTSAVIDVLIDTDESATASQATVTVPNTLNVSVEATNGVMDNASAQDTLTLVRPSITSTMDKRVAPSGAVSPGDRVVVSLRSRVVATSNYVTVGEILVEDAWTGNGTFWDVFTLAAIQPTQVPADAALRIEWRDTTGTWRDLAVYAAQASPHIIAEDSADVAAALAGTGHTREDVVGLRFHFTSTTGLAQDTTVTPYFSATARDVRRSGSPVTTAPGQVVNVPNSAFVTGGGDTPDDTPVDGTGTGTINGSVTGAGPDVAIAKDWNQVSVAAQSGQLRQTSLAWSVVEGYSSVTITDTGDGAALADSVYDAFDLERIAPINANSTPFTQGWYLKYDTVERIELFDGTTWNTVTEPAGGWINAQGRFVGYVLTASERASTQGVRIVLGENVAARAAAAQIGSTLDPYAPEIGSGVAASTNDRVFTLQWQVRNTTRSTGDWVTESRTYNTATPGVVSNVVTLDAVRVDGTDSVAADDPITIMNPGTGVWIRKQVNPTTPMYVPDEGVDANLFPAARFVVEARNNSVSRASYLRVTDSPGCLDTAPVTDCETPATAADAVADPFDTSIDWLTRNEGNNPFDRFTLTNIDVVASAPSEIDRDASIVWLLRYNAGVYTTEQTTVTAAHALPANALTDVVGVSVTYQGTNPSVTGGTISSTNTLQLVLDVRARTHLRSSGAVQDLVANQTVQVPNGAVAQSYDVVLNPGEQNGAYATATAVLTGGDINVGAAKTVSPSLITEPRRHDPVTVTIGANQGTSPASTLAPAEVRLVDSVATSPEFWDYFNFVGLGTVTAPAGADRVTVGVYGPFGPGGAYQWVDSAKQELTGIDMPVTASQYPLIEGVRFVFSRDDGGFFSTSVPAATWSTAITYDVVLRDELRTSGVAVDLPDTVENVVEVVSDRLNGESSVIREAAALVTLSLGTFELEVAKVANDGVRSASAGESVPWDLTFTNAGTGYLTIEELRDELPPHLVYLGTTAPVYTPEPGGLLGTPSAVTRDGSDIVFTWPAGGRTMAPGETFSVRLELELQPGLGGGQRATNTMVVTTAETLDRCGPVASGNTVTDDWTLDPTTCGASDYVTPTVGPNLFTVKGVRGAADGAINPVDPSVVCLQSLTATGGDYYRAPCAANSVVGGVDEWVLHVENAGTTGVSEIEIFDALPAPSDTFLISGGPRGSDYRPQMLDDLAVELPVGATYTVATTSSVNACRGTWNDLANHEPCEQNGEAWVPADAATDWSAVTAVRIKVDFTQTQSGALLPGDYVDVTFSTENVPASSTHADGAPVAVPVVDTFAWNQFGVKYRDQGAVTYRKISPAHVGVHLVTGSIEVHKEFTGSAAALAPLTIMADVRCEVAGQSVDMGSFSAIALRRANGYEVRIDGIPVGSDCVVSEQGSVGAFFEVARLADNIPLSVSQAIAWTEPVPADHIATLINQYEPVLAFTGVDGVGRMVGWTTALLILGAGFVIWADRRRKELR